MAVTANPQSALPPPLWDETIVPALRKRLQDESRVLAKRISSSSIGTDDDRHSHYDIYDSYADPEYPRPTAIPQPSVPTGRPSLSDSIRRPSTSSSRSRTLSQPRLLDRLPAAAKASGSPPLPRTASPHVNGPIPTRIPMARTRTTSVSSYAMTPPDATRSESRSGASGVGNGHTNGYAYHYTPSAPDLQKVPERNRHGQPIQVLADKSTGADSPRASTESEERPFEHWYRGEVSRNGGVGEYRVGRRQEMLDIANYGHKASRPSADPNGWQTASIAHRRRGSTGMPARESFYLDPDATANSERVLDETPPSGLESDDGQSMESLREEGSYDDPVSPRTSTPTAHYNRTDPLSTPVVRQASDPHTPTQVHLSPPRETPKASALTTSLSAPGSSRSQTSTPPSQAKRRAKSPAAATPPSSKKTARTPTRQRKRDGDVRRSVAEYPVPVGDADMSDAIPTWTQPVPATGNWDDVILPVVARKKGLDGHYVQADGSSQVRPREEIPEPAPGTFGFDYSKYKPAAMQHESIPMDEFGQQRQPTARQSMDNDIGPTVPLPQHGDARLPTMVGHNAQAHTRMRKEISAYPDPLSSNSPSTMVQPDLRSAMTTAQIPIEIRAQHDQQQQQQAVHDDGGSASCCKCVIM